MDYHRSRCHRLCLVRFPPIRPVLNYCGFHHSTCFVVPLCSMIPYSLCTHHSVWIIYILSSSTDKELRSRISRLWIRSRSSIHKPGTGSGTNKALILSSVCLGTKSALAVGPYLKADQVRSALTCTAPLSRYPAGQHCRLAEREVRRRDVGVSRRSIYQADLG